METTDRRSPTTTGIVIAAVFLVGLVALVAVAAPSATAAQTSDPVSVYADSSDTVTVLYENGTTKSLGVTAEVVGPMADVDGDGTLEVPYVDSNNNLYILGLDGESETLVNGNAAKQKDYIATGDWNDDGTTSVFYENTSDGKLYRVESGGSPKAVLGPDGKKIATNSVLGVADYDGDGDRDLVFLGSSDTAKYYDGETINSTGFSSFGSNNGLGVGEPTSFEDRGVRIPYITGSNNLALLAADGGKEKLNTNYGKAVKAPVAAVDWNGDGRKELMHVNTDNNEIYVGYLNGSVDMVTDDSGSTIQTTASVGIIPGTSRPAPRISEYNVTNPEGREVRVSFNSSDQLTNITIDISGAESATLTEADTNESGSGPYTYTATYQGSVDGDYTATLVRAENSDGVDGASGENGTVTVDTPAPTVDNVTLTDATDGDGLVTDGDSVRVETTVLNESKITSVTADVSAFGGGSINLTHKNGSTYVGNATVDGAGVGEDGNQTVTVTATNEYDKTDRNDSDAVFVDTTPPDTYAGPDATVEEDTKVIFNGRGTRDNYEVVAYEWDFDDGTTATGDTATHTFADPGTYTVTLTAVDAVGQASTDTMTLEVTEANDTTSDTSDTSETDSETTETETVHVYHETKSQTPTVVEYGPTKRGIVNHSADEPVAVSFEESAYDDAPLPSQVSVVPERNGSFNLSVNALSTVDASAPNDTDVAGYFAVNHTVSDENISSAMVTVAVPKSEVPDEEHPPVVYRRHNGSWQPYEVARVGETNDTVYYATRLPGLSEFAFGYQLPDLDVNDVQLDPEQNSSVAVSAVIRNDGAAPGTESLSLQVDGRTVTIRNVTVPPGENRTVTIEHTFDTDDEHQLSLNGQEIGSLTGDDSGSTTVTPSPTDRRSGPGTNGWLLALLFGTLLGGGGITVYRQLNSRGGR